MKNNLKKIASLALIGAAFSFQHASAQVAVANGDLIFGAETINSGSATGTNLEVDLGQITQFTTTSELSFPDVSSVDLSSVLGSGYATATNAFWSVAGTTGTAASGSDVGGYFKGAVFLTLGANPGSNSEGTLSQSATQVASLFTGLTNLNPAPTSAPNSGGKGVEISASSPTSYSSEEGTSAGSHVFFTIGTGGNTSFGSGETLDLYALNAGGDGRNFANTQVPAELLGAFSYSKADGLTFTGVDFSAAAVPEPSTYALLGLGAAALFFVARRRALQS
jgi:PEP-CTERM motif